MSDNIIIRLTAESELDNANMDLQALQDREKDLRMEMLKSQAEYQKQNAAIQATVKGREAQIAALDKLSKKHTEYQRSLETEQKKVKTSMDSYSASLKNVNDTVADSAVKTPKLTTQIRLLKDELAKMEASGISPSDKSFVKLAVNAARLEDQMGDTQQRVRILASDTKNLDAAMGIGQGLAGGFTAATSAAALLGGESEELQKAFFKVQAVMSILNGVNQVAIALNKDSAARVVIGTAIENNNTIAKIRNYSATKIQAATTAIETAVQGKGTVARAGATAAQWLLNASMYAFPLVAIVAGLTALTFGIISWTNKNKEAKKIQDDLKQSLENTTDEIARQKIITDAQLGYLVAAGKSKQQIRDKELGDARKAFDTAEKETLKLRKYYDELQVGQESKANKEALENLNAAIELQNEAAKTIKDLKTRYRTEDLQAETDAEKTKKDEKKKADEKRIADAKSAREKEISDYLKALDRELALGKTNEEQLLKDKISYLEKIKGKESETEEARFNLKLFYYNKEKQLLSDKEKFDLFVINKKKQIDDKILSDAVISLERQKQLGKFGEISESEFAQKKLDTLIEFNASAEQLSQARFDVEKAKYDESVDAVKNAEEKKQAIISASVDLISNIGNALFDLKKQQLDQEMSDLEHYYTTDAEEAKTNKDKKLISEKDLESKKLDIRIKQAKADKQQALFNIAIDTIRASIAALPNIPLSIIVAGLGLVAAATVAAKPLPKYAKGKKAGGKGHFATVGELGAETMWVPDGAAIIPHNKPINLDTFADFNIPTIAGLGDKYIRGGEIDYNKLGRAVADNIKIPQSKPVTVNIDKSGITTHDGLMTVTHLNKKYTGAWN